MGVGFSKSTNDGTVLRCYRTSEGFRVVGFGALTASTTVNIFLKLRAKTIATSSVLTVDVFGIHEDNTTRISQAQVGTLSIAESTVPSYLLKR